MRKRCRMFWISFSFKFFHPKIIYFRIFLKLLIQISKNNLKTFCFRCPLNVAVFCCKKRGGGQNFAVSFLLTTSLTIAKSELWSFNTCIYYIQCVPRKWFGSAVCIQRDSEIVYIVSLSADPNYFRRTVGISKNVKKS